MVQFDLCPFFGGVIPKRPRSYQRGEGSGAEACRGAGARSFPPPEKRLRSGWPQGKEAKLKPHHYQGFPGPL